MADHVHMVVLRRCGSRSRGASVTDPADCSEVQLCSILPWCFKVGGGEVGGLVAESGLVSAEAAAADTGLSTKIPNPRRAVARSSGSTSPGQRPEAVIAAGGDGGGAVIGTQATFEMARSGVASSVVGDRNLGEQRCAAACRARDLESAAESLDTVGDAEES
jgi:hypothetical protein